MIFISGSPTYLAPEVLQGSEHSIQSDLWSFGCLLYEMYTGHPPFAGDTFQELVDKILSHDLPPPKVKGLNYMFFYLYSIYVHSLQRPVKVPLRAENVDGMLIEQVLACPAKHHMNSCRC